MAVDRRLPLDPSLYGQSNGECFKWTNEVYMKMAKYLSEHYDLYSAARKRRKTKWFLRLMTTELDVVQGLDDTRIHNGFWTFLNKYERVKAKMNSDGTAQAWTLEQCPYFYILDATFARTPKDIAYVYETEMGDTGNEVTNENNEESVSEDPMVLTDNSAQQRIETDTVMSVRRRCRFVDCSLFGSRIKRFKWTSDVYMKMAKYLSEHYDEYSAALQQRMKNQFLRVMMTRIDGLESLTEQQIDGGFYTLLKHYKLVKAKVNLGGEQHNGTAHKEEILEQCPYFYILDETFARTPKDIIYEPETGDIGNEGKIENDEESISEDSTVLTENSAQQQIETDTMMAVRRSNRMSLAEHKIIGSKSKCYVSAINRKSFMWTSDDHMKVAKYLSEHYDEYSAASKYGNKMQFLRIMRTKLDGLEGLTDIQIKGGFTRFIKKYELAKVNLGGKQKGKTHKRRILEQCPYFYILDATFAKTPKDVPPCIAHKPETGDMGNEVEIESDDESSSEDSIVLTDNGDQQEIPEIEIDIAEEDNEYTSECQLVSPPNYLNCDLVTHSPSVASCVKNERDNGYSECQLIRPVSPPDHLNCDLVTRSPSVANVKDACQDIGVDKGETNSSIDTLIECINSKIHDQIEVKTQKLEERKFEAEHAIQLKKLDIEHLKVKTQSECETQRLATEKAKNELEFQKFKMQQENELKKLELEIELEKLKRSLR